MEEWNDLHIENLLTVASGYWNWKENKRLLTVITTAEWDSGSGGGVGRMFTSYMFELLNFCQKAAFALVIKKLNFKRYYTILDYIFKYLKQG